MKTYFIAGGAGFIGSHLVAALRREEPRARIVIYDNFSSGRTWYLDAYRDDRRVRIVRADIKTFGVLRKAMKGAHAVYHFAANPDIAAAVKTPDIDFWEGTYLTNNILEAMRQNGVPKLLYASGSGVYGDAGHTPLFEDYAPLLPVSTYGASKLACEALISSYCHMFGLTAAAFRMANVVGPRQTHGVAFDFIRRLLKEPDELAILGDGRQSKSYIHVADVIGAMRRIEKRMSGGYSYFNVATNDSVTVTQIAELVRQEMGLGKVRYRYTGGRKGWRGDVPVVRFDTRKLRRLGWKNAYTSREALTDSIRSMRADALAGRFSTGRR